MIVSKENQTNMSRLINGVGVDEAWSSIYRPLIEDYTHRLVDRVIVRPFKEAWNTILKESNKVREKLQNDKANVAKGLGVSEDVAEQVLNDRWDTVKPEACDCASPRCTYPGSFHCMHGIR